MDSTSVLATAGGVITATIVAWFGLKQGRVQAKTARETLSETTWKDLVTILKADNKDLRDERDSWEAKADALELENAELKQQLAQERRDS